MHPFLFTNQDDRDDNYLVYAEDEKAAEAKLAKYLDLEELGASVSDCFYLRDITVVQ